MAENGIPDQIYDVVIIGGGPAGFTAGLYTARGGMKTLLLEGASTVSQITVTDMIENFPGIPEEINGFDLVERFRKQAVQFGVTIASGDVQNLERRVWNAVEGWQVMAEGKVFETLSVIVATGASWRRLGVTGEEAFIGRGVSFCATCDGPLYRDREVVVVGGGNAAIQEAIFLTRFVRRVTVVHRRDRLRASDVLQKRAFANPKISWAWNAVVEEISGREGVDRVRIKDVMTGESREMAAEGVFIFVGLNPNTAVVAGLVALAKDGAIIVDRDMKTSIPGIFACGDCIEKHLRQVITACGDGAMAAYSAQLHVEALKGESY